MKDLCHAGPSLVPGEPLDGLDWSPGQPLNFPHYNCMLYNKTSRLLFNHLCSQPSCPVCQMTRPAQTFVLRGACLHSSVDSHYVMRSSTEFQGYIQTRMVYSAKTARWEIVQITNTSHILAVMETEDGDNFPLGLHPWYFLDSDCTDPGVRFRSLNLHLEVEQPGHFCCDDGTCIQSNLVCNFFPDCKDGGDEKNCTFMHFQNEADIETPPGEFKTVGMKSLLLNTTFQVLQIFDINDLDSVFDLQFTLEIQWFDENIGFEFLKSPDHKNYLWESTEQKIWTPDIEFSDTENKKVLTSTDYDVIILRRGKAVLDADLDLLRPNEVYAGRENPFKIFIQERIQFSCSFDNIRNFPFGQQKCFLKFEVKGTSNFFTTINPWQVVNKGPTVVGQYVVDMWRINNLFNEETGTNMTRVTMVLSRNIESIFLVTYLPTILMNMINQATNYITGNDKYSLIYTINITCMMVLTSIYLSVSASLPNTSDIKPIEVWLLFNLAFPFVNILINVILQVNQISVDERSKVLNCVSLNQFRRKNYFI